MGLKRRLTGGGGYVSATRSVQAVATRGSHLGSGLSDGTVTVQTSVTYHEFACDCTDVQLVYGNYYDFDTPGPNNITIKAAIHYGGKVYRLYFPNGTRSFVLEPGADVETKAAGFRAKKGEGFYVRTMVTVGAGEKFPRGLVAYTNRGEGFKNGDIVDGGATDAQGQFVYHPVAIVGRPKSPTPAVLIVGDSIASGAQDNPQDRGFIPFALGADTPWIRVSKGNESCVGFKQDVAQYRLRLAKYCTHAIVHVGTNDLAAGQTFANLQASLTELIGLLNDYGLKSYVCTIPPRTSSTDAFATVENQTSAAPGDAAFGPNSHRSKANDWLRSKPPGVIGVFDTGAICESSVNSGKWKVTTPPATTDGIHPKAEIHALMAAPIIAEKSKF